MNNKNIILAGAIAIGVYLFSQGKSIFSAAAQKVVISKLPVQQIRYQIAHAAALGKTREEVAALKAEEARRVARSKAAVAKKKNENTKKKQIKSKLFPGSEKSRVIPYSESSKHSYYGSKSHRLQNEGYGKGKAERDKKQALEFRLDELRDMFPLSNL